MLDPTHEQVCYSIIHQAVKHVIHKYPDEILDKYYVYTHQGKWRVSMYLDVYNPEVNEVFELHMDNDTYNTYSRLAKFMEEFEEVVLTRMGPLPPEVTLYEVRES